MTNAKIVNIVRTFRASGANVVAGFSLREAWLAHLETEAATITRKVVVVE